MANGQSRTTTRGVSRILSGAAAIVLLGGGLTLTDVTASEAADPYFTAPDFPNVNCEFQFGSPASTVALAPQMVANTVGLPVSITGTPAPQTLVVGQLNGTPAKEQIFALLEDCGLTPQDWTLTNDPVVPPANDNQGEATLDLTVVAGLMPPNVTLKVVNTGGNQGEMLELGAAACGLDVNQDPSTWRRSQLHTPEGGCIITNSYGTTEQNVEGATGFLNAIDDLMSGLAQAGVIVLFSAGDEGSGGCTPSSIGVPGELAPQFLASHPDVLSVGGTMWVDSEWDGADFNPYSVSYRPGTRYRNVTWRDEDGGTDCTNTTKSGTGGGASLIYSRPAYQDSVRSAVPAEYQGARLVPDLAGLAGWPMWAVLLPVPGNPDALQALRGTSAATPLTAVGLAHINAALTARGLSPVDNSGGALDVHSVVYNAAFASAFTDVTEGSNALFGDIGGWSAQVGYDMTTGMGVPNFTTLLQLLIDAQTVTYDPQGPPPVLQQVPIPESGSCLNVDDTRYNWGGADSGGWGQSWAQWANAGAGGPICTRTLVYNSGFGIWVVER